jgi:aerobic C4-dicarboxylate transport protein
LILGLVAVNVIKPGQSFHADLATLDAGAVKAYANQAAQTSFAAVLRSAIPQSFSEPFSSGGNLLQVILLAVLFGCALKGVGERGTKMRELLQSLTNVLFRVVHLIMQLAPFGAFGAMAFTVGRFGLESFAPLASLMATFYLTCVTFVIAILGPIAWFTGFNIFRFVHYIRGELLTVLATSSSESVLVPLMEKLEHLGCKSATVGLVVPAGYSFNLDGTNIYLTLAMVFIAQALGLPLTLGDQLTLLLVAVLTSKGASGVTGAGFITLAATLTAVPTIPVAGLTLLLGIDRFMSEARALTNIIGNGVATLVISRWERELDVGHLNRTLRLPPPTV